LDELVRSKNPALKSTSRFHVSSIELELEFRLPTSELVCATLDQEFTKSQDELYEVLRNEVNGEESVRHGMFGWPDEVQGDMRLQCQLASNGIYCGDLTHYDHPRFAELEDGQQNWVLLLQIDTDEDGPGWMWGDCGRLYFWIHEVAFEACDFDNAWVVLQCY